MSEEIPDLEDGIAVPETWTIQDLATADWALSRIADLEREIAENESLAETAIARIKLRTELLNERASKGLAFFRSRIEGYAQANREHLIPGKKKTRSLLHGSISWRSTPERLKVVDASATLTWAQTQPIEAGLIRIKEELDKPALNALFKSTGEMPPGTELEPAKEELQIKAELGGTNGSK